MDITILNNDIDITNIVEDISLNTTLFGQAGTCELSLVSGRDYPRGSIIDIPNIFYGYIFETSINGKGKTTITAYDQMRYLKNEDTIYIENMTADQILLDLAKRQTPQLKTKIITPSKFICLPYLHEKTTMFSILRAAQDETLRNTQKLFVVRDNYGTLEFNDVANWKTNLQIGTALLMTDFDYVRSIDSDTYNVVKLTRDNKETVRRDVWQVQDSDNIKRWGKLQFYDNVSEEANEAQIKELANNILKVKNRETRSLSFSAIGFYNLKAGDGIKVVIDNLIDEWFYISSIDTQIKNGSATMDIEVFIP